MYGGVAMKINNYSQVNTNQTGSRETVDNSFQEPHDAVVLSGNITDLMNRGQENVLKSFGPIGVEIQYGKPSFFGVTHKNNTKVTVTDRRIYGTGASSMKLFSGGGKGETKFNIPFENIVSLEKSKSFFNTSLCVRYREGNEIKDLTITGPGASDTYKLLSDRAH